MHALLNRTALDSTLSQLLAGTLPELEFRKWLDTAVIGDSIDVPADDEDLVAGVVGWLETQGDSSAGLRLAAWRAARLLKARLTNEEVTALLDLARTQDRLVDILDRVANARLTRTAFLAFLSEQRWPARIRQRVGSLDASALSAIGRSLGAEDYEQLAKLVL